MERRVVLGMIEVQPNQDFIKKVCKQMVNQHALFNLPTRRVKLGVPCIFLVSLQLILILFSMSSSAEQKKIIKVASSNVLSGPWAMWGQGVQNGIVLGSESDSLNFKYDFDFNDDRCDPKEALQNIQRSLFKGRPDVIFVGCMEVLEVVAPLALKNNIPVFAFGYVSESILKRNKNVFSLNTYADSDVRYLLPKLKSTNEIRTIGVVFQENNVGEAIKDYIINNVKDLNLKLSLIQPADNFNLDIKSISIKVLKENPQMLFVDIAESQLTTLIKEIKRLNFEGEIYTNLAFESVATLKEDPKLLEGIKYSYPLDKTERTLDKDKFNQEYQTRFKSAPETFSAIAFDGMNIVDKVLKECHEITIECINDVYAKIGTYKGVAGNIDLFKDRSAQREYGNKVYRSGKFVWLE